MVGETVSDGEGPSKQVEIVFLETQGFAEAESGVGAE